MKVPSPQSDLLMIIEEVLWRVLKNQGRRLMNKGQGQIEGIKNKLITYSFTKNSFHTRYNSANS